MEAIMASVRAFIPTGSLSANGMATCLSILSVHSCAAAAAEEEEEEECGGIHAFTDVLPVGPERTWW
jgi:hypothetical protein